jgi:hypothetical protein
MHAEQVLEFLRTELRKYMNEYADNVATGSCQDFAEYKRLCGVIEGLALAEREILDIRDKLENS